MRFSRSYITRKGGLLLALAAATSMAIGPTVAYAGESYSEAIRATGELAGQLLDVGEEGYEYDISKSETVYVTGAEGNVYTGEALDPIFMYDSANSSLNEYGKSTEKPNGYFFSKYLVEYENNVNAGTATYTITGGKDLGAADWASKYVGTLTGTFEIAKADLSQAKAVALADGEKGTYLATGKPIAPKMKVALTSHQQYVGWDSEAGHAIYEDVPDYMASDDDWSYVYRDADGKAVDEVKTASTYTVEAVAKSGNVTGTSEAVQFTVTDQAIALDGAVISDIEDQQATSAAVEPDFTVTLDGTTLEKDIDYTVSYADNVNVGTATATVAGIGIYQGTVSKTFNIVKGDVSGAEVSVEHMATYNALPYTGSEQKPKASVLLREGGHYDSNWNYVYDVEVELKEGVDYEISYANTKDVWKAENICDSDEKGDAHETLYPADKQPTITVKGIGNFEGKNEFKFSIVPAVDIGGAQVRNLDNPTFNGKAQAVAPKDAGVAYINLLPKYNICSYGLKDAQDVAYTVSYKDAEGNEVDAGSIVNAGSYSMVLTGLESGGFYGTKEIPFAIAQADFADVAIGEIADQIVGFDGSAPEVVPAATYTTGEGDDAITYELVAGKDFDVAYTGSAEDGAVRATLTPKGNFAGEPRYVTYAVSEAAASGELAMAVPVNWTSVDGRDYNSAMKRSVTDKVTVKPGGKGAYEVSFKAASSMVAGVQYPVGTDLQADADGVYRIEIDNIDEPLLMFVSVPMSPNKGYTTNMMLDLDNAEYTIEDSQVYDASLKWEKEDGSDSMVQNAGYIPAAKVMKSGKGYQLALQLTDEAKSLITGINDMTAEPYVLNADTLTDRIPVTFKVGAMPNPQTAYIAFSLGEGVADQAASAKEKAAKALKGAISDARAVDTSKLAEEQRQALAAAIAAAEATAANAGATTADVQAAVQAMSAALQTARDAVQAAEQAAANEKPTAGNSAADKAAAEKAAAEKAAALAKASNINTATVSAAQVKKASDLGATTVTLGAKVKKIAAGAFKGTRVKTVVVKTTKLNAKRVKNSLKGSAVATVKVQVKAAKSTKGLKGKKLKAAKKANKKAKATNKKYVKKYKKIFTKKVAGKKAKVK